MNWKSCVKRAAILPLILVALSANKCDPEGITYKVEDLPKEFRHCARVQHVNIEDYVVAGKVPWKNAQRLLVAMTANRDGLERCHAGTVRWIDAQHAALNRYLGQ